MSVNDKSHPHSYNVYLSTEQADMLEDIVARTDSTRSDIMRRGVELAVAEMETWLKSHPDPSKRSR